MEKRAAEVSARKAQHAMKLNALRNSSGATQFSHDPSIPSGPKAMRTNNGDTPGSDSYHYGERSMNANPPQESKPSLEEATMDEDEMASVRSRYMGIAPTKVKKRRLNDRKFVFDWSTDADTSVTKIEPSGPISVSFGRGHLGGFESVNKSRGSLDRHWSEKELIEMTERDWRIFREDFSISTKG